MALPYSIRQNPCDGRALPCRQGRKRLDEGVAYCFSNALNRAFSPMSACLW